VPETVRSYVDRNCSLVGRRVSPRLEFHGQVPQNPEHKGYAKQDRKQDEVFG